MNQTIRIIKRKNQVSNEAEPARSQQSASQNSREVAATIKLWISEFKERRSTENKIPEARVSLLNPVGMKVTGHITTRGFICSPRSHRTQVTTD